MEAVRFYKLAAHQGYANSQYHLALCYQNGNGAEKNENEATRLYQLAADQGYAAAQNNLATFGKDK